MRALTSSPWTAEDRALMLARTMHRATLCPRCGFPKDHAWHLDNEGYYEVQAEFVCHPCTVRENRSDADGRPQPVKFLSVVDTRDYDAEPLPGRYTDFASPGTPVPPAPPDQEGGLA